MTSVLPSDTISSTFCPPRARCRPGFWPTTSSASVPSAHDELVTLNPRSSSSRGRLLDRHTTDIDHGMAGDRMATTSSRRRRQPADEQDRRQHPGPAPRGRLAGRLGVLSSSRMSATRWRSAARRRSVVEAVATDAVDAAGAVGAVRTTGRVTTAVWSAAARRVMSSGRPSGSPSSSAPSSVSVVVSLSTTGCSSVSVAAEAFP